ncbi:phage neck terminator protein [Neorhizobium sp. LjRoot104]|uniref:phage neck terminator protein n=1 Tax=Neorhizobium sp. LjRoot104 TaxID=3342254 RepID=UPI003ED02008
MTNDEVWSAVVRWVRAKTGKTTIKSHEGGPAPTGQYVVVNFTGSTELHNRPMDIEYAGTTTITATPVIEMEWRFSVHAYGADPTDILRPVVSAHKLSQVMEPLFPALTVHEISQIRNVPDWINNAWQPRAQMDLIVHGIIRDSVGEVDAIEEYGIEIVRAED